MPEQDKPKAARKPVAQPAAKTPEGERIAKVLSRAGIASRREAERLIEAGEVKVNGRVITSPALNVTDKDRITVSGQPLAEKEPVRVWLYYKPEGLVTSASDEKGRETVFDALPPDMPRVMSIGRLDLNSEGLLLLTNDGGLKRKLELPSTGWLRKYRVRLHGNPTDADFEPLRKGIEVEGERFQPMQVTLDRVQGANAWATVGLREGKNREIRRAMSAIGLTVNRLIRISYGPFRLNELEPGQVEEIRPRVLRDQLGFDPNGDTPEGAAPAPAGDRVRKPSRSGKIHPEEDRAPRARATAAKPARGVADSAADRPARKGSAGARLKASADRYLDAIDTRPPRGKPAAARPEGPVARGKPATTDKSAPRTAGKPATGKPEAKSGPKSPARSGTAKPRSAGPRTTPPSGGTRGPSRRG